LESTLARNRFRFDLSTAFIQVVHGQHLAGLAAERHALSSRIAEIATERARAGKIAPIEETRLRTSAALASTELEERKQELKTARLRLASLMGVEEGEFAEADFRFEQLRDGATTDQLRADIAKSSSFARIDLDVAKARADLELERANSVPDLSLILEANYQPFDKRTLFAAGFSLPLPLFDRNQGGRGMAAAQVLATTALADRQRQNLAQEVEEAHATLTASLNKARVLKTDVLPGLEQSLSALETAYRQGRIGYLDVVESQEGLFAVREKALEAAARYHTSFFKLESLLSKTRTDAQEASADATDGVTR
jgi:cobalt-zinc-cadmium efflux system outer membrane protein